MPIRKDIFEIKSPKFAQGLTLQLKSLRNARNVRMWLAPSGILSVTKPFYVSKAEALKFVDDNSEWIIGQLASFKRPETLGEWLERNPVYSKSGPMKVWLRPRGSEFFCKRYGTGGSCIFIRGRDFPEKGFCKIFAGIFGKVGV